MENSKRDQLKIKIWIKGHIDRDWSGWFSRLKTRHTEEGSSILYGTLEDQAALFGCLLRIRDLGLVILKIDARLKEVN